MRQVNEAELVWALKFQLSRLPASIRKGLTSSMSDQRRANEQLVAVALVREALRRYEILSDTPLPDGSDLFSSAAYETGDGRAPAIDGGS